MKNRGKLLRRALGLLLAAALLLPLTGPGVVLEASAVTKAEIDALKGDAKDLASQRKEIRQTRTPPLRRRSLSSIRST